MKFDRFKILSGSVLKLIAVISMLIDHAAHILWDDFPIFEKVLFTIGGTEFSVYYIMRCIGRLAFPLFCFLIVEGYLHTKSIKKYLLRLSVFAIISEIPFNLLAGGTLFYISKQNVYFTLALGVMAIWLFDKLPNHFYKFCALGLSLGLAYILHTDYGINGIILIILIYVLRNAPSVQALASYFVLPQSAKLFAFCAFVPINMYNGERGFIKSKALKFGFYIFYPLHILILVLIEYLV